ncbi:MAG: C4-dicarboxylate ABC transporter permease [Deltaproteobacteria bacterium]|nr:MAG: C4-dicarboxylate ABC transporter permease [Deltaproteobacteria bacterium]
MTPVVAGVLGTLILLLLFMTAMPVAYSMALVGFAGFAYVINMNAALNLVARDIYSVFSSFGLTVIPLFILMGQIAYNAGISRRLYDCAHKLLGSTKGGLAAATVAACTAFGAVCGSSPATAATMAVVGLPEMKRYKYGDALATGSVAAGGSLGMLMPPSVVMIIYGILTEQSIGQLFIAAIVPAIYMTAWFCGAIWIYCRKYPEEGPAGEKYTIKEKFLALFELWETLTVFGMVMLGLLTGVFTPTEAGAVGAALILALALLRKQITWRGVMKSFYETVRTSCMVLFLIAGATLFGHFLAVTRIPFEMAGWIGGMDLPSWAIMGLIILLFLIGGCFIDAMALVMLTIPIFYPIVVKLGYDPIWFGVMIVLISQMGVITPPVGINVYVVQGIATDVPLQTIFKGAMPFLVALILGTASLVAFPQIVTFFPSLF